MLTIALLLISAEPQAPRELQPAPIYVLAPQPSPWTGKRIAGLSLTLTGASAFVTGAAIVLWGVSLLTGSDGFFDAMMRAAVWYVAAWTGGIVGVAGLAMLIPGAILLGTSTQPPAPPPALPAAPMRMSASFSF